MESAKVVSEQECPTVHGVIILSREYPGLEDQQTAAIFNIMQCNHAQRFETRQGISFDLNSLGKN